MSDQQIGKCTSLEHYLRRGVYEQIFTDSRVAELPGKTVISIVVPVYNPAPHHLNNCIRSVLYQAYPHWQLCLCDDCSTEPHVRDLLADWEARDKRIQVICHEKNTGISGATNSAASIATGDYLGFLDNDDELTVDCLYQVVKILAKTGADLVYTDEDLIGEDGRSYSPFFKPDFNRELLLCHNYITHFVVTSRALFEQVGGCDPAMDGAQDFDLLLELTERAGGIAHVPEVVYHWRASATSTSVNHEQKSYADEAGRRAVTEAMARRGINGEVRTTEWKYYYRVLREVRERPPVTVILTLKDDHAMHRSQVESLLGRSSATEVDFLLASATAGVESRQWLAGLAECSDRVASVLSDQPLSHATLLQKAIAQSRGRSTLPFSPAMFVLARKIGWSGFSSMARMPRLA